MRAFRVLSFSLLFFLVPLLPSAEAQEPLRIIGWNAESGDADPATIAQRIAAFNSIDIWAIVEVRNADWADQFAAAAADGVNADFESVLSSSGGRVFSRRMRGQLHPWIVP